MARGGAREGAGRKSKAEKYRRPIAAAERQIVQRLPELLERQLWLALGVPLVDQAGKPKTMGGVPLFAVAPDRAAGEYLIDKITGKNAQPFEGDVGLGSALKVLLGVEEDKIWPRKAGGASDAGPEDHDRDPD